MPVTICRILLRHCTCRADSRALFSAGRRMPIRSAMIPMTTSSSTSVNAWRGWLRAELLSARFPMFHDLPHVRLQGASVDCGLVREMRSRNISKQLHQTREISAKRTSRRSLLDGGKYSPFANTNLAVLRNSFTNGRIALSQREFHVLHPRAFPGVHNLHRVIRRLNHRRIRILIRAEQGRIAGHRLAAFVGQLDFEIENFLPRPAVARERNAQRDADFSFAESL